jgi:hypothetical protein
MTLAHIRPNSLLVALCLSVLAIPFGCASSPPAKPVKGDRVLNEASVAARSAFQQNRTDEAATFYTLALKRARALDRPSAIGDAAYNLGACLLRLRKYERAQALFAEAHHELARADVSLADVLLLQARAARLNGDAPAAETCMRQLRTDPRSRPSEAHLSQAIILEGQMACDRNDWKDAKDLLSQARDRLDSDAETLMQAQLAALAGRIAAGLHDFRGAADVLDQQADLLRKARQYRALSSVLGQAGDARAALNEHALAADRFYRAARTAAAWSETASAKKWAVAALAAAQRADDAIIAGLAESLLSECTIDKPLGER